jgi:microcystin-dependent protein
MAQQKQITLRNVKGSALTYVEMDRNLSSFFHSASLSGTDLLLHYTGSTVLGPDYTPSSITVPLNPLLATITQLTVAGNFVGDIQYRINNTTLGANSSFKWDTKKSRLGVGVASPAATVHVLGNGEGSIVRLSASGPTKFSTTGYIDFTIGGYSLGSFGKTRSNSGDIYTDLPLKSNLITTVASADITRTNSTGLGIFTNTVNNALTVVGEIGVGTDTSQNQGLIGSIITAGVPLGKVSQASLPTGTGRLGLLIESPKRSGTTGTGGHVVVGINATGPVQNTAFSVVAGANGNYTVPILTATATGQIGINKPNPVEALDVFGNTTMTGTLTIKTVADSQGVNSKVLTVNGSGLVQYSNNLMPLGGIIMWGGPVSAIPTGWRLCDGGAAVNGITIPDLRERFIVGAGGDNPSVPNTSGYNVDSTGGESFVTLQESQMPAHGHRLTFGNYGSGQPGGSLEANSTINTRGDGGGDGHRYMLRPHPLINGVPPVPDRGRSSLVGGNQQHENRPPYYALAFIIYTGI